MKCGTLLFVSNWSTYLQDLMYDPNSPILDFYPEEFEQDLNGKKQDWEAIVKIPFIDSNRLLHALACAVFRSCSEPCLI